MNIIRRGSVGSFPRSVFDDLFAEPFFAIAPFRGTGGEGGTAEGLTMGLAVDVSETEKDILVRASLPGFKKEDVSIEVHDGVLTISAQNDEEKEEKGERYHRRERRMSSMSRSIALPAAVEDAKARAELKDGVLTLSLPKHEKVMPKKISIN
jgi:HSP20 family protein